MGLLDKLQFDSKTDGEIEEEFEPEFGFERDPEPADDVRPRSKPKAAKAVTPPKSTAAMKKLTTQVAEDLATVFEVVAAVWGMSDECCAPALEQQARPIADALTGILARNPRVLMALANSDMAVMGIQTIALGRAVGPVVKRVYRNHVSKAVDDVDEGNAHDHVHLGNFPAFSGANGAGIARSHAA